MTVHEEKKIRQKRSLREKDPRQLIIRDSRIIVGLLSIMTIMGAGAVLYQARSIVLPFLLAILISYFLNPLIAFFEKRRVPVSISIVIALLITFLFLGVVGLLINNSIQSFVVEFPRYETRVNSLLENLLRVLELPPELFSAEMEGAERIQILGSLKNFSVSNLITQTLSSITNFLSNTVLVMLFLLFILMGRNQLDRKIKTAFSEKNAERLADVVKNINQQVQKYIFAKTVISLITAIMATVILSSFNVKFAFIWGILTFLLNYIPSIGSVIATVMPLGIAFIQFDSVLVILGVGILLAVVQFTMGNLIEPRVVGRRINLSPLVILSSLIFWGWLWGILGMFLAVPLTVVIKIIFENIDSVRFISVLMSARQ